MAKVREGYIPLDHVHFNQKKYPREHYHPELAKEYAQAMINGAEFPKIILEEGTNDLLDGKHRYEAYKHYHEMHQEHRISGNGQLDLWPDPPREIPCEWHTIPEGKIPKLYALSFQRKHGLRATAAETKHVCREQYQTNPMPLPEMSADTGVPRQTLQDWLQDLMNLVTEERNAIIARLDRLGWTQEEISGQLHRKWPEALGMSRPQISVFLSETPNSAFPTKSEIDKLGVAETVKRHNLPEILVWALKLDGLDDLERLGEKGLNLKIQPYDAVQFSKCDERFGTSGYPGQIPAQLVAHILYWFTQSGDLVIDPMAGGGTVPDVCLAMGRQCYAYDVSPSDRVDILLHDLAHDGWPDRLRKANLIFWDPPYFNKKDEGYPPQSISRMDRLTYLAFFEKSFRDAKQIVNKGTRLAFLMSDWNDALGKQEGIFIWHYADLLRQAGWSLEEHLQVPLSTQQVHPDIVNRFRIERRRARLERYLLLAKA